MGIVVFGVGTCCADGTARMDGAVAVDDIVVADVVPMVILNMHAAYLIHGDIASFGSGRAVDDDLVDRPHVGRQGDVETRDFHSFVY